MSLIPSNFFSLSNVFCPSSATRLHSVLHRASCARPWSGHNIGQAPAAQTEASAKSLPASRDQPQCTLRLLGRPEAFSTVAQVAAPPTSTFVGFAVVPVTGHCMKTPVLHWDSSGLPKVVACSSKMSCCACEDEERKDSENISREASSTQPLRFVLAGRSIQHPQKAAIRSTNADAFAANHNVSSGVSGPEITTGSLGRCSRFCVKQVET